MLLLEALYSASGFHGSRAGFFEVHFPYPWVLIEEPRPVKAESIHKLYQLVVTLSSIKSLLKRFLLYLPVSLSCYNLDDISLLDLQIAATPLWLEKEKMVNFPSCGHALMHVNLSIIHPTSFNVYFFLHVTSDLIKCNKNWSYCCVNSNSHTKDKTFLHLFLICFRSKTKGFECCN